MSEQQALVYDCEKLGESGVRTSLVIERHAPGCPEFPRESPPCPGAVYRRHAATRINTGNEDIFGSKN